MANPEHVKILKQGVEVWNWWREANLDVLPDLSLAHLDHINLAGVPLNRSEVNGVLLHHANLRGADLHDANLVCADFTGANLRGANLSDTNLYVADLSNADLRDANLHSANLRGANLSDADLYSANLSDANLREADLSGANLIGADLSHVDLSSADLNNANLNSANLSNAILNETDFEHADISGCQIYGIAAWNLNVENLKQANLIITDYGESEITVDNLEIAQFVYLLLNNAKLRGVIDTLTTKSVLILGRFTPERKSVLDGIREALRQHGYVPMLFDFDKPANRDLTETVMTLASLARFVIADLSDPNSIPHELMSFADKLFSVPVQGIFCPTEAHPQPYPMYEHLRRLPHVLPIYRYETADGLMAALEEKVIRPAEDKVKAVRPASGLL